MKYFYITFCLILVLSADVFAQSNYKPGYAIGIKGDTLKGFIDYREWGYNPDVINFKRSIADKQFTPLTAKDITYFEVTGLEAYQRYSGPISTDAVDPNHASLTRDTSTQPIVTFLKVLQQGKRVSLYSYNDALKPRFFIKDASDSRPRELIYRVYVRGEGATQGTYISSNTVMVYENEYYKQLTALAVKYNVLTDDLENEIGHADYYKQNLIKIVSTINGISKTEYQEKYNEKTRLDFFVSGAMGLVSIKPYGTYAAAGGKSASPTVPEVSVGINMWADPNTGRIRLLLEGMVSGNKYNSIYIYTGSPYVPVRYSYKDTWLALSPQVVYNYYNTTAFKAFIGLGIAFTVHNYSGTYDISYQNTQVTNAPLKSDNFLNNQGGSSFFDAFNFPLMFKAGMCFGEKIEIFARYFTPYKVSQDHYFQLNTTNTQIGLSYLIK